MARRRRGPRPTPKGPQTWVVNGLYHVTAPAHVKARDVRMMHGLNDDDQVVKLTDIKQDEATDRLLSGDI